MTQEQVLTDFVNFLSNNKEIIGTFQNLPTNNCNNCTYKFNKTSTYCPMCGIEYVDLIEENFTKAYTEIPHTLIRSNMIYMKAHINGHEIKFLVDTGAESSIIPHDFIEACGLSNIVDRECRGTLVGVGTTEIVGRIHYLELVLPNGIFPCSFTISSNNNVPPILGIDMMHNLGITIDFKRKKLCFEDGYALNI
jgi:predicted aspartyl protease